MTKKARTKDELFMLKIYQESIKQETPDHPFNRYEMGKLVGLQEKAVDTICTLLLQANFLKKENKTDVSITPHGVKLVINLLEEERVN